jgi:hypothetical protein
VLSEGAGKLTLADQNEEGANILTLQTRQQLGTISLSLANQAQQEHRDERSRWEQRDRRPLHHC